MCMYICMCVHMYIHRYSIYSNKIVIWVITENELKLISMYVEDYT